MSSLSHVEIKNSSTLGESEIRGLVSPDDYNNIVFSERMEYDLENDGSSTTEINSEIEDNQNDNAYETEQLNIEKFLEWWISGFIKFTDKISLFIYFVKDDWAEYEYMFTKRYHYLLATQLSIFVVLSYVYIDFYEEDYGVVLMLISWVLLFISVILLPYSIFITCEFLYFVLIDYTVKGIVYRYPEYCERINEEYDNNIGGYPEFKYSTSIMRNEEDSAVHFSDTDKETEGVELTILIDENKKVGEESRNMIEEELMINK